MTADVSVIIPCRNEAPFLDACLASIRQQQLGDLTIEILVIDGGSTDGTREMLQEWQAREPRLRVLDNPKGLTPVALNLGLARAQAPIVIRMDAHSLYPPDYVTESVRTLQQVDADNVGGLFITQARHDGFGARLVQAVSTHRFGVGNAEYRLGHSGGYVDTVPYGCYHREVFERLGGFDERLRRNQDYEFNQRLRASGGKIWLNPRIRVLYFNQASPYGLLKQALLTAQWNVWTWYVASYALSWRHTIPGLFSVFVLAGGVVSLAWALAAYAYWLVLALYGLLALVAAVQQCARYRDPRLALALPPTFVAYHLTYGLGTLLGLAKLLTGCSPVGKQTRPWQGASAHTVLRTLEVRPTASCAEMRLVGRTSRCRAMLTRLLDVTLSLVGLLVLSPVAVVVAVAIRASSPGPVLFTQWRVGQHGTPFRIYKFRTMRAGAEGIGNSGSASAKARATAVGSLLRASKLDEIPQLLNVLRGDMSLVGPRPDVPAVVAGYTPAMRRILQVKPGITSVSSLELADEERLVARAVDPDWFYTQVVVPAKVAYAMRHVDDPSLAFVLRVIGLTVWRLTIGRLGPRADSALVREIVWHLPDRERSRV
jgi:succinoglycan biosynthesis protein ExoA